MLTSSWMAVIAVVLFFLFLALAFIPGEHSLDFIKGKSWFGIVLLILMVIFFLIASGYIFNWAVNWTFLKNMASKEWFGFVVLIIIAAVTAGVISKKTQ
jgi:multisubunit Na+/H+ antiporter MnhB subunit